MSLAETWDYGAAQATARFECIIEEAVNGADILRDGLAGATGSATLPELAHLLAAIRDAQGKLAMLQRECEANLADAVKASGSQECEVPGVGVLKLHRSTTYSWDSSLLLPQVLGLVGERVAEQVDVPADVRDEYEAAMVDVLQTVAPVATQSFGWKATGLRECGIDPDGYRQATKTGGYRVQITEAG